MKTILRCFTIAILSACVVTQKIFPCYSNETKNCTQQRLRCCALSGFEFACCLIAKQVFMPTSGASLSENCIAVWCPYNIPCNNTTDTIGVMYEWATTGCVLLSAIKCAVGFFPCVTEDHYKKVRKKICCYASHDSRFCPEPPTVILNADATRD
jgi:hypothetical protein